MEKSFCRLPVKGWPWLPGDLFVPVEAFDFIPSIQKATANGSANRLPRKGVQSFEIILQFVLSEGQKVKGSISPTTIKFTL